VSFRAIVADPPWSFGDKLPGKNRGAEKNYDVLSIDDICGFPVPPTDPDSWLFLWRVSSQVEEAYRVVRAWGFIPKSEIVWEKVTPKGKKTPGGKPHFGMGRYVRASHETCIVAVKGCVKPVNKGVRSRFSAPTGRHSEKPQAFFDLVDQLVGPGPKAEMFARTTRPGYVAFGNEVP
jgi:N6-adenosine-specific RNA methylase IME4